MTWRKPGDKSLVRGILQAFQGDAERSYLQFSGTPEAAWKKTDFWLNASGLALYFFDQVCRLGIADVVPQETCQRLRTDLRRNKERAAAMFREFCELNELFRAAGVEYVNHKGFTLCPHACMAPELRHQIDFDFIVARRHLALARELLESRGYTLAAAGAETWEFKAGNFVRSKWDQYSMGMYRCVELHFADAEDERLKRAEAWIWEGSCFPAFGPADQLIDQAVHLFRHIRSENTRPAWLLEFHRHVVSRREDVAFWRQVRQCASTRANADIAFGMSILIASQLFGQFAPTSIEQWALGSLSPTVRLWGERYGVEAVIADFPGTKLFLLLEEELETLHPARGSIVRERLLPIRRPRAVFSAGADESLVERLSRCTMQLRFVLFRARFHIMEAARYFVELPSWRRLLRAAKSSAYISPASVGSEMTTRKQLRDNLQLP